MITATLFYIFAAILLLINIVAGPMRLTRGTASSGSMVIAGCSILALACLRCNLRKSPNLTGIDPITGEIVPLFDPRRDRWPDHFRVRGPVVEGITAIGRTTVRVFSMNDARRIERRELLAGRSDVSPGWLG